MAKEPKKRPNPKNGHADEEPDDEAEKHDTNTRIKCLPVCRNQRIAVQKKVRSHNKTMQLRPHNATRLKIVGDSTFQSFRKKVIMAPAA